MYCETTASSSLISRSPSVDDLIDSVLLIIIILFVVVVLTIITVIVY